MDSHFFDSASFQPTHEILKCRLKISGVSRAIGIASDEVRTETPSCDDWQALRCEDKAPHSQLACPTGGHGPCWAFELRFFVFSEKRPAQLLMPVRCSDWEYVEFIFDAGATSAVMPVNVGKACEVPPQRGRQGRRAV